jgi:hypothetical protein
MKTTSGSVDIVDIILPALSPVKGVCIQLLEYYTLLGRKWQLKLPEPPLAFRLYGTPYPADGIPALLDVLQPHLETEGAVVAHPP